MLASTAAATSFELSLNFDYHPFIIWSYRCCCCHSATAMLPLLLLLSIVAAFYIFFSAVRLPALLFCFVLFHLTRELTAAHVATLLSTLLLLFMFLLLYAFVLQALQQKQEQKVLPVYNICVMSMHVFVCVCVVIFSASPCCACLTLCPFSCAPSCAVIDILYYGQLHFVICICQHKRRTRSLSPACFLSLSIYLSICLSAIECFLCHSCFCARWPNSIAGEMLPNEQLKRQNKPLRPKC